MQRVQYRQQCAIHVGKHTTIPQPQNAETLRTQEGIALEIMLRPVMLRTVHFHDQAMRQTDKVSDITPDCHLSPEFEVFEAARAQFLPEFLLGIRHHLAQVFGLRLGEPLYRQPAADTLPRKGGGLIAVNLLPLREKVAHSAG
jgi:hypothetical protein